MWPKIDGRVNTATRSALSFAKSKPRESALLLLACAIMAHLGVSQLSGLLENYYTRKSCVSDKDDIVEAYESVDDLISSAYRLDSYGRTDIDGLLELKRSVDFVYEECKGLIPGWS